MKHYCNILYLIILTLFAHASNAGEAAMVQHLERAGISNSSTLTVKDPVLYTANDKRTYETHVNLIYGREQRTDKIGNSWTYSVVYTLTFFDDDYKQVGTALTGNTLTVEFNNNMPTYLAKHVFKEAYANYGNVKLTVTSFVPHANAPQDIRLELELVATTETILSPSALFQLGRNNNLLYWSFLQGAETYQLEWVFIDAFDKSGITSNNQAFTAKRGVKIQTSNQHYELNITLPSGYLYYRVRGIGVYVSSGSSTVKYGAWKDGVPIAINEASPLTEPVTFEKNKTWQYVTSYAEEGKYKKVVTFYDGSLRNRQVATNISSDSTVLVAETKYDFEGRGTVSILPIAFKGSQLAYRANLNTFQNGKQAYDNTLVGTSMNGLTANSQASIYYSDQNTVENINKDYLPQAGAFPFMATQYMRDGTGRVQRQSNVGETFRLKDPDLGGKYTEFVYGNTNSTELHRLFGSNVGVSAHYKKNYVIDPNGQINVSYLDQEDRVVATALAGNAPLNLDTLQNNQTNALTVSLSENNVLDKVNFVSKSTNKIVNTIKPSNYTLRYDLDGIINDATGYFGVCKTCTYDLKITVKGPDGVELTPTSPIIRNDISATSYTCADATFNKDIVNELFTFNKVGEYVIEKELTLSTGAIDILLSELKGETNYPDSLAFIEAELLLIDTTQCDITCEDHCYTKIFAEHTDWAQNTQLYASAIEAALQDCLEDGPCTDFIESEMQKYDECKGIKRNIKFQVSPGGYYNNLPGWLESVYQSVVFKDLDNHTVSPTPADLRNPSLFLDQWAEALWVKHPEHCHFIRCQEETFSRLFDLRMARVTNWEKALEKGYLNPLASPIKDPLFLAANFPYPLYNWGQEILDTMNNYMEYKGLGLYVKTSPTDLNPDKVGDINGNGIMGDIWDFASSYLPYGNDNSYTPDSKTKWITFRSLYHGMKLNAQLNGHINKGAGCPYISHADGGDVVVKLPVFSPSLNTLNNLATSNLLGTCQSGCVENVKVWMVLLENKCGEASLFGQDSIDIAGYLSAYCLSSCGSLNPFGLLLKTDLEAGNTNLQNAQIKLLPLGCNLYSIAIENPYLISCIGQGDDKHCMVTGINACPADLNEQETIKTSNGVYLDGVNDYISIPGYTWPTNQKAITVEFWIKSDESNIGDRSAFSIGNIWEQRIQAHVPWSDHLLYWDYGVDQLGTPNWGFATDYSCYMDKWTHVALVSEGSDGSYTGIYLNGELVRYDASSISNNIPLSGISIGAFLGCNCFHKGMIRDFRVWNKVRSGYEINSGMNAIFDQGTPNLTGYWKLDEGNGTVAYDASGHGNNGSLIGGATWNQETGAVGRTTDPGTGNFQSCVQELPEPNTLCDATFTLNWTTRRKECIQSLREIAIHIGNEKWKLAQETFRQKFLQEHFNKCFDAPFAENFRYEYSNNEYQYTLYYYDQAGNLVQTVPPEGVNPLPTSAFNSSGKYLGTLEPDHHLLTRYKYNSLNQLLTQITPDGGQSWFFYDGKGQLRLSHNSKQKDSSTVTKNIYAYTRYDEQGRIIEVGEARDLAETLTYLLDPVYKKEVIALLNNAAYPALPNKLIDLTKTVYDKDASASSAKNLRGRVVSITTQTKAGVSEAVSLYSYDPHGNVQQLTQQIAGLGNKTIDYAYDLISGKVNAVYYQKGQSDQFAHRYRYDADNRLTHVLTSSDGAIWEEDARYFYYKHGPLARTELGQDKVQGEDNYYTLQGWLKGVNIPSPRRAITLSNGATVYGTAADPGVDGMKTAQQKNINSYVAQDQFAYNLAYFDGDYKAVATSPLGNKGGTQGISLTTDVFNNAVRNGIKLNGLYNGNIVSMTSQVHSLNDLTIGTNENNGLRAQAFRYDQLNRLTQVRSYDMNADTNALWTSRGNALNSHAFDARYSYDANGNITNARINGATASLMDNLNYKYDYYNDGTKDWLRSNRLYHVNDLAGVTSQTDDLEDQGNFIANANTPYYLNPSPGAVNSSNNYSYDQLGNLIKDNSEEIESIRWTVYGKVREVKRTSSSTKVALSFLYDGMGNRTVKIVKPANSLTNSANWTYKYYVRDASGNIMATYDVSSNSTTAEYSVYGSARLGTYSKAVSSVSNSSSIPAYNGPVYSAATDLSLPNGGGWYTVNSGQRAFVRTGITYTGGIQLNAGATLVIEGTWNNGYIGNATNTTVWIAPTGIYNAATWNFNGGDLRNWGAVNIPDIYIQNNGKLYNYSTLTNTTKITTADGSGNQVNNFGTWTISSLQTAGAITNSGTVSISTLSSTYNNGSLTNNGILTAPNASFEFWNTTVITLGALSTITVKDFKGTGTVNGPTNGYATITVSANSQLQSAMHLNNNIKYCDQNGFTIPGTDYNLAIAGANVKFDCNYIPFPPIVAPTALLRKPSLKEYELANHLGNVYLVVSGLKLGQDTTGDGKVDFYQARVLSCNDYNAFGSLILGRTVNGSDFGFNGKEKDPEGMGGGGSTYDYGFRIYNAQLGKFLSVDPLTRKYSYLTPYQFASNSPIVLIDIDGLEGGKKPDNTGKTNMKISNSAETYKQGARVLVIINLGYQGLSGQNAGDEHEGLTYHFLELSKDKNVQVAAFESTIGQATEDFITQTVKNFNDGTVASDIKNSKVVLVGHSLGADQLVETMEEQGVKADLFLPLDLTTGPMNDNETLNSKVQANLVIHFYQSDGNIMDKTSSNKSEVHNIKVENVGHQSIDNKFGGFVEKLVRMFVGGTKSNTLVNSAKEMSKQVPIK